MVRTSSFHVEDTGSIPVRDRYLFPAGGIIAEWSLAIWLEKVVRELSEKAENTFFLWITLTFHVSHVLCTEKDWFKRSVCRIQNSCFNKLHLINLPTNACWKRGYERWILLFRGWFFLPDSPVCYNWCPAYKQVACELSINCECSHRIGSYSHKSFISYMFPRKKLGE